MLPAADHAAPLLRFFSVKKDGYRQRASCPRDMGRQAFPPPCACGIDGTGTSPKSEKDEEEEFFSSSRVTCPSLRGNLHLLLFSHLPPLFRHVPISHNWTLGIRGEGLIEGGRPPGKKAGSTHNASVQFSLRRRVALFWASISSWAHTTHHRYWVHRVIAWAPKVRIEEAPAA